MIEMELQLFGGRGSSSGGGGGSKGGGAKGTNTNVPKNQSEEIRSQAQNAKENNSEYKLGYTETIGGSTWMMYGAPKGLKSERGNSGAELTPVHQGEGYTLSRWTISGDQLPKKTYSDLNTALKATKDYLRNGWKKTK